MTEGAFPVCQLGSAVALVRVNDAIILLAALTIGSTCITTPALR
jgi:hypothetical protein